MEQGRFSFGDAVVLVPPPAYPPGAALFEHQRALGIGILEPSKAGSTLSTAPPAEHSSLVASTAHRVWPAAYALAMSLHAAHPVIDVRGRAVLELGAGCGLPGLAAWRAGAASVCLTELPENLPRLQQLVHHNGASGTVSVEALDAATARADRLSQMGRRAVGGLCLLAGALRAASLHAGGARPPDDTRAARR